MDSNTIVSVVALGAAIIIFVYVYKQIQTIQPVQLTDSSISTTRTTPLEYTYKLLFYSPNIHNNQSSYGLFQSHNQYYIVQAGTNYLSNVKDIYPAFKGKPIGFVVVSGNQNNLSASFIIFSSDGKVYNPYTISHLWRQDFIYLPLEDPISVDGRPISDGVTNGTFTNGNLFQGGGVLFRFYYQGYYIEESGCSVNGSTSLKSCTSSKVSLVYPQGIHVSSFYQYGGDTYAVSTDGWIYTLSFESGVWKQSLKWLNLFNGLNLNNIPPPAKQDKSGLYLMGADYDGGVPIFLLMENNVRWIVDKHARKYDFLKSFGTQNILPSGNPLDFTKIGSGEYDYVVLYTDKNLYGPTLKGSIKPVSSFELSYPSIQGDQIISITSVAKWGSKYYLVFLYKSGKWFEIQYDIVTDIIGDLGETDQTNGLWTQWQHVKSTLSSLSSTQTYKISSQGWSVFVFDPAVQSNCMVYSINNQPQNWINMLYCTFDSTGTTFSTDTCVGLGKWNTYPNTQTPPSGRVVYPSTTSSSTGTLIPKVSLEDCLKNDSGMIVYDEAEANCYLHNQITKGVSDPTKTLYVNKDIDALYRNHFCVKHVPTGKYLYWDFTDPNNQHLGLSDFCIYQGVTNLNSATKDDITKLQQSMGAMWEFDGCLQNLNGAVGGALQSDNTLKKKCNGNDLTFVDGALKTTSGTCFHASPFGYTSDCSNEWSIEEIPCPKFDLSGGGILNYCKKS
jgi:hypothetical protein